MSVLHATNDSPHAHPSQVAWMLILAIMAVSKDLIRIGACAAFVILHGATVAAFRYQFRKKGRPAYPEAEMVCGVLGLE